MNFFAAFLTDKQISRIEKWKDRKNREREQYNTITNTKANNVRITNMPLGQINVYNKFIFNNIFCWVRAKIKKKVTTGQTVLWSYLDQ